MTYLARGHLSGTEVATIDDLLPSVAFAFFRWFGTMSVSSSDKKQNIHVFINRCKVTLPLLVALDELFITAQDVRNCISSRRTPATHVSLVVPLILAWSDAIAFGLAPGSAKMNWDMMELK